MKLAPILCVVLFALGLGPESSRAAPSPLAASRFRAWAKAKEPSAGPPAAIGGYAAGCLSGANRLALDGEGYAVMRPSRRRYYGHPALKTFVEGLGKDAKAAKLPLVLVGDLGGPRGGPMISGHASHQTGLDVDLWYLLSKKRPSAKDRERWGATNLVRRDGSVNKLWGEDQIKLVEMAASNEAVDRIFVHAALKKNLCGKFAGAAWLGKLRPWWGHADHFHVRLRCPPEDKECTGQEALALNDGCGPDVDWWFSAEAKEEGAKKSKAHAGRDFPELPAACSKLMRDGEEL
ncbi:MAG: penicillin-insensitive murein endopeptidase [Proteobacteria bacterium]|nr:MAG: penicillin-insensitive murein endopeptidase [Pseudomonadota bacterium]